MFSSSCLLLALVGLALAANQTTKSTKASSLDISYYYSVASDKDGDFILTQLIPQLQDPTNDLLLRTLPIGGVEFISNEEWQYFCHGKKDVCQTSKIQVRLPHVLFVIERTFANAKSVYFSTVLHRMGVLRYVGSIFLVLLSTRALSS